MAEEVACPKIKRKPKKSARREAIPLFNLNCGFWLVVGFLPVCIWPYKIHTIFRHKKMRSIAESRLVGISNGNYLFQAPYGRCRCKFRDSNVCGCISRKLVTILDCCLSVEPFSNFCKSPRHYSVDVLYRRRTV